MAVTLLYTYNVKYIRLLFSWLYIDKAVISSILLLVARIWRNLRRDSRQKKGRVLVY